MYYLFFLIVKCEKYKNKVVDCSRRNNKPSGRQEGITCAVKEALLPDWKAINGEATKLGT